MLRKKAAPGNKRKEFGTSTQRNLMNRDDAPAPLSDLFRQGS
jgi:hypothetical protein